MAVLFLCSISIPPPPLNPLSPPEGTLISSLPLDALVLVSVALCNRQPGCATTPYSRSLCSPFAGGKAMGLTILFPMEISALPKKRTVGSKPPTAFSSSRCYHGETLHCGYGWGKEDMGTARPQTPATSPKNSCGFALRGVGLSSP